jgi:hypothetical protein
MAGLTEFYCGWNEPSHASQFKWLENTFKGGGALYLRLIRNFFLYLSTAQMPLCIKQWKKQHNKCKQSQILICDRLHHKIK